MYRVLKSFSDSQDGGYIYRAGDVFPRPDAKASAKRIAELASKSNKRKEVLIEYVADEPKPKKAPAAKRRRKNAGTDSQND